MPGICVPLFVNWIKNILHIQIFNKHCSRVSYISRNLSVTQLSFRKGLCQCAGLHKLQKATVVTSRRANPNLIILLPCVLEAGPDPAVPFTFQTDSRYNLSTELHSWIPHNSCDKYSNLHTVGGNDHSIEERKRCTSRSVIIQARDFYYYHSSSALSTILHNGIDISTRIIRIARLP